jgi:hypothetical protein
LRAALPEIPFHGDVFHIEHQCETLANRLMCLAQGASTRRLRFEHRMEQAKLVGRGNTLSLVLTQASQAEVIALSLVKALTVWLERDILVLAGPSLQECRYLFDFIVAELKQREPLDNARIRPVSIALSRQRKSLLGFAKVFDHQLTDIAERFQIPD